MSIKEELLSNISFEKKKNDRVLFKEEILNESFIKNGFVVVDFLNASEIQELINSYQTLQGDLGEAAFASTIMSKNPKYRFAVSSIINKIFRRAIQELFIDVKFFWGNFNIKYPNKNNGVVPLHQDPSFLDERNFNPLGIWVPLVDTNKENGALQVIPGSHTILDNPRCGGQLFPYSAIQDSLLENFGKSLFMKAGQAYIGNPALFHASPSNESLQPRIVAACLAGPTESELRYHHYKITEEKEIAEMFEVDNSYYLSAPLFSKPNASEYELLESINIQKPPSREVLFQLLNHFNKREENV
ncbi:phytanoyl-CoA dioxygenase family protein [uncultured Aquimarina sp.]|uniref:phytanoyl-CoA dioxygenase family protein n=1 Tax=uncultured Aquimarina sp. TaxID=575652 RepID=UPI002628C1B3|nr:phytanoyl-CoA dioxygenase family protein [uncultured Aquimarina sp.]